MRKIIYQLTTADIQTVAQETLQRNLSNTEIKKITDRIADNLAWHDAIQSAIHEFIGPSVDADWQDDETIE